MPTIERLSGEDIESLPAACHSGTATSFFDGPWVRAWERAFLPSPTWRGPVFAYRLRDAGWLALARQRAAGALSVASLAGYYWPFRTVALDAQDQAMREIAQDLSEHLPHPVLRLGPISSRDSRMTKLIGALADAGWRGVAKDSGEVFEMRLPKVADDIYQAMSGSLLKNIRYSRRRLERERGRIETSRHVLGPASAGILQEIEAIEAGSWVTRKGGHAKFVGEANRRFWTLLGASAERSCSEVVFWILRCGATPIAFSAHVETASHIFIIANSYLDDWKESSPGSVLSLDVLADACTRGKEWLDWGQGDSGYKSRWGATAQAKLQDVMLFAPSAVGRAMSLAARLRLRDWQRLNGG